MMPVATLVHITTVNGLKYKIRIWHYSTKQLYKRLHKTLKQPYVQAWHNEVLVYLNTSTIQHYKVL